MKLSQLVGRRTKETPRDVTSMSHQFLLRGGYIRPVASGIYSILPLGKKILSKIEGIIREEMNAIQGQEVLMPVVMPRELWEESGRYHSIDDSMVRFQDRNEKDYVLGMTHEEAVVALARTEASSYKQFPFMLYQIQTKFRDELRPRGGLIRVREFTMKDAYSFHLSEQDLAAYYQKCYQAYERIFKRVGLKNVRIVQSDTGMMGGSVAHEFMLETAIGEDSLVLCDGCGYAANDEVAICHHNQASPSIQPLQEVKTPSCKTIEDLCRFLQIEAQQTAKAVFYSVEQNGSKQLIFCLIRGDRSLNEVKLAKILKTSAFEMATEIQIRAIGAEPGYASPLNLTDTSACRILVDCSVFAGNNLVTGANKRDVHLIHFDAQRDLPQNHEVVDLSSTLAGDSCATCKGSLRTTRGIEIGNIFQLGVKYSKSMNMHYLDEHSQPQIPLMGCYGIGVGRLMAAMIEDQHDKKGPIWSWSIAPYHVHLCVIDGSQEPIKARASAVYEQLKAAGFEVLWDDSNAQAGAQFADADLIGAPIRLIISPRNEAKGEIEFATRNGQKKGVVPHVQLVMVCEALRAELF